MPRIPAVERDGLTRDQQLIFDSIASSRVVVDGAIQGPYGIMLYSPDAARIGAELGMYFRQGSVLPDRLRHVVALAVARELDCQYEFTVHAELGRQEGLSAETVIRLGQGLDPEGLSEVEMLAVRYARQLTRRHEVDRPTFDLVQEALGVRGLADLTGNIGYLMFLGCFLNAYMVEVRPEQTEELPPR